MSETDAPRSFLARWNLTNVRQHFSIFNLDHSERARVTDRASGRERRLHMHIHVSCVSSASVACDCRRARHHAGHGTQADCTGAMMRLFCFCGFVVLWICSLSNVVVCVCLLTWQMCADVHAGLRPCSDDAIVFGGFVVLWIC